MPRIKNAKNLPKSKEKKLYKIGQLCEVLNISARNLRYLEQLGFFPHLKRSLGKTRLYDESDLTFIKNIYDLKNKKGYSFHKIKDLLLNTNKTSSHEIAVITDADLSVDQNISDSLCMLPLKYEATEDITNHDYPLLTPIRNSEEITQQLKIQATKRVYAILSQRGYDIWKRDLQNIKIPNVKISIHKVQGFHSAAKLLSEQLIEAILNKASVNELDLLISKQIPMTFSIGYLNSLSALFQNQTAPRDYPAVAFIEQSLHFKGVFVSEKERVNLEVCCKKEQEAIEFMIEKLTKELENRGFYCNRVLIKHSQQASSASKCLKHLQSLLPDTLIMVDEMNSVEKIECGNQAVLITII